jgi:hypothetical protein
VDVVSLVLNFQKDGWLTEGQTDFLHQLRHRIESLRSCGHISKTPAWYQDVSPCLVTLNPNNLASGFRTLRSLFEDSMVHPVRLFTPAVPKYGLHIFCRLCFAR